MPFTTQSRLCGVTPSLQHENDFIKLIQIGKETITAHPQCEKKKTVTIPYLTIPSASALPIILLLEENLQCTIAA